MLYFQRIVAMLDMATTILLETLKEYSIKIDSNDFDGFGFDIKLKSTIPPYRPQDGIISAGDDFFAWLAAVPNGKVTGNLTYNNLNSNIKGHGYHDHNWGNIPLQKIIQ